MLDSSYILVLLSGNLVYSERNQEVPKLPARLEENHDVSSNE